MFLTVIRNNIQLHRIVTCIFANIVKILFVALTKEIDYRFSLKKKRKKSFQMCIQQNFINILLFCFLKLFKICKKKKHFHLSVSLYPVAINLKIHLIPIYGIIIHFNSKHRLKWKRER